MPQKLKRLNPSLREKKRYLEFEVISEGKVRNRLQEVVSKINEILGFYDSAEAGVMPVKYEGGKGIIRTSAKMLDKVRASFLFIKELGTEEVIIRSCKTYGTLKKAKGE